MLATLLPQAALLLQAAPLEISLGATPVASPDISLVNAPTIRLPLRAPMRPSPILGMPRLLLEGTLHPGRLMHVYTM